MNIKIVKNGEKVEEYDKGIFYLSMENKESSIKTDVENLWEIFGQNGLSNVVEDFLLLAIAVYSVDKKVSRTNAKDSWGREINLNIPVLEIEKWETIKLLLDETLSFLSGDIWKFNFYHTEERLSKVDLDNNKPKIKEISNFDCVSLFSGGVDSFCGALKLLEETRNPFFVGFKEYTLLSGRQISLYESIMQYYNQQSTEFIQFYVNPGEPENLNPSIKVGESSSRSRSFLFIAGAITVASMIGNNIPVYIPENGFIGINVPLTQSRSGSCSTRTTHPYFIKLVNQILGELGIRHEVVNFYSTKTKGEIIAENKGNEVFIERYKETLSCSHPVQSRYDGISPPINCGYCYPCLIRRSSLVANGFLENHYNPEHALDKEFLESNIKYDGIGSDLRAVLYSIRRYVDNRHNSLFIRALLRQHGKLSNNELDSYESVYRKSLEELITMIEYEGKSNNGYLKKITGI